MQDYKLCISSRNEVTTIKHSIFSLCFFSFKMVMLGSYFHSVRRAWHFSHWILVKVNPPYTKFFPIKKRVQVKLQWASTQLDTEENSVTVFIFYIQGPNVGNRKSVCQKNKTRVILTSLCWAISLLNFYFWKWRYPFNPVTELLMVVRRQRKIGTGPVPARSPRAGIKRSTGKQKHFAREFCETGVSVHSSTQKTPPKCKPFQTQGGPWSQINTEKLPEPQHG